MITFHPILIFNCCVRVIFYLYSCSIQRIVFCRYFCACACYGICLFQYYRVLGFFAACNLLAFHVHISAAFEHVLQSGSQLKSFMIINYNKVTTYKLKQEYYSISYENIGLAQLVNSLVMSFIVFDDKPWYFVRKVLWWNLSAPLLRHQTALIIQIVNFREIYFQLKYMTKACLFTPRHMAFYGKTHMTCIPGRRKNPRHAIRLKTKPTTRIPDLYPTLWHASQNENLFNTWSSKILFIGWPRRIWTRLVGVTSICDTTTTNTINITLYGKQLSTRDTMVL